MSIHNKINEVWRDVWSSHVKINGVWRDSDVSVNINGVWREVYKNEISADEILGFRLVYTFAKYKSHPDHPSLCPTHNLPVTFALTGDSIGNMDLTQKGVLLEYERDYPFKEGIFAYEGHLYAELINGVLIDVGLSKAPGEVDDRNTSASGIDESWSSSKLTNLDINITGYTFHESHGYYTAGWNSMFSTIENIDKSIYPYEEAHKSTTALNRYQILPLSSRDPDFAPIATIGIARDMHSADKNMVGSYGRLDHTITDIYLNGYKKPFTIEYYG